MTVAAFKKRLSQEDVQRLVKARTPTDRAEAAGKICLRIDDDALAPEERAAADQILQIMANDAAKQVRLALAVTLRNSVHLPHDVAVQLANDLDEIAAPVLQSSPVLTETDLIDIVRAASQAKMRAVAARDTVPTSVCETLVERGDRKTVLHLSRNQGALIDEDQFDTILNRFGDDEAIDAALVDRAELPVTIAERLVSLVSDELLERLASRHKLPPQLAVELAEGARERATIDILDQCRHSDEVHRLVQQLQLAGRLTPSLVLRSVVMGQIEFFEHAMAELANVPHEKAWLLVHDAGPLGLRALFDRTGIPSRHYPAIRAAVDIFHQFEAEGALVGGEDFARAMIERVLTQHQAMSEDDLAYLLDKLDAYARDLMDMRGAA